MKKILLLCLLLCGSVFGAMSQQYLGFYTSPYAGVAGAWQQPASIAGSDQSMDFVLFGASAGVHNDFMRFGRRKLIFKPGFYVDLVQEAKNINDYGFFNGDLSRKYLHNIGMQWDMGNPSGIASFDVALFHLMYRLDDQSSIAVGFRQRGILSADNISKGMMWSSERFLSPPQYLHRDWLAEPATSQVRSAAWKEIDLTYARVLKANAQNVFKAGITAKLLFDGEAGFVNARGYNFTTEDHFPHMHPVLPINDPTYNPGRISGVWFQDGTVGYADKQKFGMSLDFGFEYEYRPEYLKGDLVPYGVKAGLSVLDLGAIAFKDAQYEYLGGYTDVNYDQDVLPYSYGDMIQRYGQGIKDDRFSIQMPTVINAQVDINLKRWMPGLFVNFNPIVALYQNNQDTRLHNMTSFNIIPHFEKENFGIAVPLQYDQYHRLNAGLSVRLWQYVWLGSNTVLTNLNPFANISKSVDGYVMVKLPLGKKDRDKDRIADDKDLCPDVFGLKEFQGCPDSDGDGIADKDDRCPQQAGPASLKGCPDKDGDGIADLDDRCPDVAGPAATFGCPDRDNDGVADKDDRCPDVPGRVPFAGCPDTDGDSIMDLDDKCPTEAGPRSNNGCPVPPPAPQPTQEQIVTRAFENLLFATDSDKIAESSYPSLNDLAAYLVSHPELTMAIEGHTDSKGTRAYNLKLSDKRAVSVKNYLVSKGVQASKLTAKGYGPDRPVASNDTVEGRQKNRRVEFTINK